MRLSRLSREYPAFAPFSPAFDRPAENLALAFYAAMRIPRQAAVYCARMYRLRIQGLRRPRMALGFRLADMRLRRPWQSLGLVLG